MDPTDPFAVHRPFWFDKDGTPIDVYTYERLHTDPSYFRVGHTRIHNPEDRSEFVDVSTVWLGTDHSIGFPGDDTPVIFETMLFPELGDADASTWNRYTTEADARNGHLAAVSEVTTNLGATDADVIALPDNPEIAPTPERHTE